VERSGRLSLNTDLSSWLVKLEYIKETMKTNQKSPEIIEIPVDPEEEKIFNWVNSDNCLGSWMPSESASINEKTKYQFSQVITLYQIKNNLEEREIANKLGLDKNTTARLLRGYVENFSLDSLMSYAEKLKIKNIYSNNNSLSQIPAVVRALHDNKSKNAWKTIN